MAWPELKKAKRNSEEINREIRQLLKNNNALSKKEIVKHPDTIAAQLDDSIATINSASKEMIENLKNHRKYVITKAKFVQRHYKRV